MTAKKTQPKSVPVDRSTINGVEVISTEPARGVVIPGQPAHEISTVEKVLDADGNEWYRCKAKPEECVYFKEDLKPILAHQRSHSPALAARRAEAELARTQAREAAEFERRSAGMNAANEAKRKRYETEVTSQDKRIAGIQRKLSDIAVGIDKIVAGIPSLAESIRTLNTELGQIAAETDPVIADKAKKYDALKGLIND